MEKLTIRMKLIFILIICMAILDIFDERILLLFQFEEDSLLEPLLDTGSSLVVLVSVLWAFYLAKNVIISYQKQENHYRNLIDLSPVAIFVHRNGKIIFTNKAGVTLLGVKSVDDLLNHDWKNYLQFSANDSRYLKEKTKDNLTRIFTFQVRAKRFDGREIDLEITSTNIEYDGLPAREFIVRDITSSKKQENIMKKFAYEDTLTKLPNRRAFLDQLDQLIKDSDKNKTEFALLFIDLDGFKKVNDSLGHDAGDELLKRISWILKKSVRDQDIVARLAGDEFTILLPNTNKQGCRLIGERIINNICSPMHIFGQDIHVTPSIGISLYPQNSMDAATLIKMADEAMYQAKNNGKNGYQFIEGSYDSIERG